MKILAVADREESILYDFFDPERFRGVELIISCGDLRAEYLSFLVSMMNVPLFYVKGNHDISYDRRPPEGCINIDGRVVEYKGLRIAGFEGCPRYTTEAVQYTERGIRWKMLKMRPRLWFKRGVDIVVAHSPPAGIYEMADRAHRGFEAFRWFIKVYKPRYFLHGHVHSDYMSDKRRVRLVNSTHIINADGFYLLDTRIGPTSRGRKFPEVPEESDLPAEVL